ncbi:MAG: hypothetical protein QJ16_C0005G0122 [archaeon GW2011_AR1]|nr:MAG: hypothetical protein QJ16_C0005G0122 [archaeon GW2011_AR1]
MFITTVQILKEKLKEKNMINIPCELMDIIFR